MTMENDRASTRAQMAAALKQLDTAAREFLTLWAEDLPPDEQERLTGLVGGGLALGLHVNGVGAPGYEVTLTDRAGERRVLTRVGLAGSRAKLN